MRKISETISKINIQSSFVSNRGDNYCELSCRAPACRCTNHVVAGRESRHGNLQKKIFLRWNFLIIMFFISYPAFTQDTIVYAYGWDVYQFRLKQDEEFRDTAHSPLKKDEIEKFTGRKYYYADSNYRVNAKVKILKGKKHVIMKTSSPKEKEFIVYAKVSFHLNGKKRTMYLYQNVALMEKDEYKDHLFLPFNDNTNGNETYGGGRYIDLVIPNEKRMTIDFNYCYNPYCAFTTGYSCPVPPRENYLDTEIKAGEMKYKD